jgi:hypothetical protein
VIAASALVMIAVADSGARFGHGWAQPLFWTGLVVLYLPIALRLLSRSAGPGERVGLLVVVGMGLYLVKVLHDPTAFTFHDELGHWRGAADIIRTGHLFGANPVVGAYPYYPGLDIVTAALVKVSGLSIFQAGLVVTGMARLILPFALFWLFEQLTGSVRLAGIAGLLYMTNPTFIFFDSQFAYESFAIPLAVLALILAIRQARATRGRIALGLLCTVFIAGVVASHHVTAYALCILLVAWSVLTALSASHDRTRRTARTAWVAVVAVLATALWLVFVASGPTRSELGPVATGIVGDLRQFFAGGGGGGKQVFHAGTGQSEAAWAQLVGYASVVLILAALPFALWRARPRARRYPLTAVVVGAAALYPATLVLDLSQSGTETSNRSSAFVFFGIALALGILVVDQLITSEPRRPPPRRLIPRVRLATAMTVLPVAMTVLLVGGLVVGWPPYDRLPGPYLTAADQRSVEPQGVDAALWARAYVGPNNRVAADDTNGLLMASYGGQHPELGHVGKQSVANLFFSPTFETADQQIIAGDKIGFVVVDNRLSRALPLRGFYIEGDEPGAFDERTPIPAQALGKFDGAAGLARIFDSGNITIYDSRGLTGGRRR